MERDNMDLMSKIIPLIWQIMDKNSNKRKCKVNVSTIDDKLTVSFLFGRKIKQFAHADSNILLAELQQYFLVA